MALHIVYMPLTKFIYILIFPLQVASRKPSIRFIYYWIEKLVSVCNVFLSVLHYFLSLASTHLLLFLSFYFLNKVHFMKSVQERSFSGPYFPVFRPNTDIYGVNLCTQSEYRKKRARKKFHIWTLFTQW